MVPGLNLCVVVVKWLVMCGCGGKGWWYLVVVKRLEMCGCGGKVGGVWFWLRGWADYGNRYSAAFGQNSVGGPLGTGLSGTG